MRRTTIAVLFSLSSLACSGESGILDPDSGMGQAQVLLSRSTAASGSLAASMLAASGPPIDFSQIESLELVVDRVEAHAVGGGAWTSINTEPLTIDLATLTAGATTSVAAGGLPEGTYDQIRFFLQSATVTFLGDVGVGNALFVAGQPYVIDIPGAENTGLKVPTAHFTVGGSEGTVVVLFDAAGTTASIGAAGNGRVRMTPVLREADEDTEAGVDESQTEDDGDTEEESEETEEESSDDGSGSGSASVLVGASGGVSAALMPGGFDRTGIAASMAPGGKIAPEDIVSLRLDVCEVRAVRTGPRYEEDGSGEEEDGTGEEEGTAGEEEGTGGEEDGDGDAEADDTPACAGNGGGAGWTRIPLEATSIDLYALGDGEVVELGFGELPAGVYRNVRIYLSGAWVTFNKDVRIGGATVVAGEEIPLRIPSAEHSGLKIPSSHFEVVADAEEAILLLFDRSSVSSVKTTGQGVQISPVLREATPAEEESLANTDEASEDSTEESEGESG